MAFNHCYNCHADFRQDLPNFACLDKVCYHGTYYNTITETCDPCTNPACEDCENDDGNNCRYCKPGFTYQYNTGSSTGECHVDATYTCTGASVYNSDLLTCEYVCGEHCLTCEETGCSACIYGYKTQGTDCVHTCDSGYYESGIEACSQCHTSCEQCSGGLETECTMCPAGKFLRADGKCHDDCLDGFWENSATKVCEECSSNCLTCQTNNSTCTSCETTTPKFLHLSSCYEECPEEGFFEDTTVHECTPCQTGCAMCSTSAAVCERCKDGYQLDRTLGTCVLACAADQFSRDDICYDCHSYCEACSSALHDDCSACKAGFFLQVDGITCWPTCPVGQAGDMALNKCIGCPHYC